MILHNSQLADGQYIGFGGQFYTLWNVWTKDDKCTKQADFLGNISKDLQTAQEKYPDATVSALKGQTWEPYDSVPPTDHSEDQAFWFGRYTGIKFEDCQDDKYMIWFYTETRQHVVRDVLISRGYQLYNEQLYTNEEFEILHYVEGYVEGFRNGTHVVEFVSNINEEYEISIKLDNTDMFPYGLALYISYTLFDQINCVGLYKKSSWYKEVKSEMIGHKNLLHYEGSSEVAVYIEDKTTIIPTIKVGDTIKIKFTVKQQYPGRVVVNRVKLLNIA